MGAVTIIVTKTGAGAEVDVGYDFRGHVRMVLIDAGIQNGNVDGRAPLTDVPSLRGLNLVHIPLPAETAVIGDGHNLPLAIGLGILHRGMTEVGCQLFLKLAGRHPHHLHPNLGDHFHYPAPILAVHLRHCGSAGAWLELHQNLSQVGILIAISKSKSVERTARTQQ